MTALKTERPTDRGNLLYSRVRLDGTPEILRRPVQISVIQLTAAPETWQVLEELVHDTDDEVVAHCFRTPEHTGEMRRLRDRFDALSHSRQRLHLVDTGADLGSMGSTRGYALSALYDLALLLRSFNRQRGVSPHRVAIAPSVARDGGLDGDMLEQLFRAVVAPYDCPRLVTLTSAREATSRTSTSP